MTTNAPAPNANGTNAAASAYSCPTADSTTSGIRSTASLSDAPGRPLRTGSSTVVSATLIAVSYDRTSALRSPSAVASTEQSLGAVLVKSFDFPHAGLATHLLAVPAGQGAAVVAALRAAAGVEAAGTSGELRYPSTVTSGYFPNDPYFKGFNAPVAPFYEAASVPGQWDMHAIKLEDAFAYAFSGNGSSVTNAAALGSSGVKVAIVDTGFDTGHPELSGKIVYQRCFITNTSNVQSTSNFVTDPNGHGTDVAGIADAATNNALGFTGAGGNTVVYAYRVFPTPDANCSNANTTDPQCGSSTADIASAIDDAVQANVNVISLSLGGGSCTSGADSDPLERAAVAEAIAAHVIVVAAAGNGGGALVAPACDTGVIAVGASALADGTRNGSGKAGGSAASPVEYVASYSSAGSPAANAKNASAWGIVAPGGDPVNSNDADDLHWVENIWTSTPYSASDAGSCSADFQSASSTTDCRTLIAGTSMATPHVAGAAALILSVSSAYQSPSAMKTLLCTTADDIGDAREGCGRLNVYRAMATALGDPALP